MNATSASWQHPDAPSERENLSIEDVFTDADAEQMTRGVIPQQMEDKWFIYFDDGWLRFHRSWTGAFIYALRMDGCPAGVRVVESWVNRDPEQYAGRDIASDRKLVRFLIDALLLKKPERGVSRAAEFLRCARGCRPAFHGRACIPEVQLGIEIE